MKPVVAMVYSHVNDVAVSSDEGGMLEYWSRGGGVGRGENALPRNVTFESKVLGLNRYSKSETDGYIQSLFNA